MHEVIRHQLSSSQVKPYYIHTYSFITQNDRTHLHKVKIQVKIRIKLASKNSNKIVNNMNNMR